MKNKYADCHFCGGVVEERMQPYDLRYKGQLMTIENVPMGICQQCGEGYLTFETSKEIDAVLGNPLQPAKTVEVPVIHFESKVA